MAPKSKDTVPSTASSSLHESELEILRQEFPNVKCYCELCDCGRHLHHKECRRQAKSPHKYDATELPETDYQATFKATRNFKPRSSKRPPMTPHFFPPPGDYNTNQRKDYTGYDVTLHKRPDICQLNEKYTPPKSKFDGMTYYQQTYTPKEVKATELAKERGQKRVPGEFDERTTHNETFKHWVSRPPLQFGDLPTFTGSILFPNKSKMPKSVMQQSYPGAYAPKPELAKMKDGNITIEGAIDLLTTHKDTYKQFPPGLHKTERIYLNSQLGKGNRGKFMSETQQMYDFPDYSKQYPIRPEMAIPAPETIDLRFDNRHQLETEQMKEYRGYDVSIHTRPAPAKIGDVGKYEPPSIPMEGMTWQRATYTPKDVTTGNDKATQPRQGIRSNPGKFATSTHYTETFKNYKPDARQRMGDFHESYKYAYIPKIEKLAETKSTTHRVFTPKHENAEMRESFKPVSKAFDLEGDHDFQTNHRADYQPLKVNLCRAQVFLLQQKIKQRRAEKKAAKEARRKARLQTEQLAAA